MKQFFVSIAVVVWAVAASGCATVGYPGISVPGYEAAGVVAGNQLMVATIGQPGWMAAPYGYGDGYANVPVCRAQDLAGVPSVSQPVIVRVEKSRRHQTKDVVGGAIVVGGLTYISSGGNWKAATAGAGAGAGGGLLVSNHEYEYCLLLPAPKP